MIKKLIFSGFLALYFGGLQAEEPWSVSSDSPVILKSDSKTQHSHKKPSGFLYLYQKYISSFDGPRCSLSPTCSGYAVQSFQQHGFIMGFIMTADRLMHEGDKMNWLKVKPLDNRLADWQIGASIYDWVWAARFFNKRPYFGDSLHDNSFWWNTTNEK